MKNKEEELLNNLFSDARSQPNQLSFEEVSNQFTKTVSANVSTQLTKKWYSKLFNLNSIIIMLSTILISGIVLLSIQNTKKEAAIAQIKPEIVSLNKKEVNVIMQACDTIQASENLESANKQREIFLVSVNNQPILNYDNYSVNYHIPTEYDKNLDLITNTSKVYQENNSLTNVVQDSFKLISYIINEKTTEAELIQIKHKAESCGLDFSYKVKIKRGNIKILQLKTLLTNKKGEKSKSEYYCNGSRTSTFEYTLKWNVDQNGNAINFDGNSCVVKTNSTELPLK